MTGLALGWAVCVTGAQAAASEAPVPEPERRGQELAPPDRGGPPDGVTTSRPDWAQLEGLPQTIRERLQEFHEKREEYLRLQRELRRELMGGATDADREQIRERIREQREMFFEEARKIREQARERMQELLDELPRHREMLEAARERAREQIEEARERIRERRGTD
jgi:chromosome segregation ATPase